MSNSANSIREQGILVVDDEPFICNMLQKYLQSQGYRVWTACDGDEALDICCDYGNQLNVVFLDVLMPILDGPQTLEGIREVYPELPVCFMTGDSGKYRHNDLLDFGATHIIHKPFRLDEISRLVRQLSQTVAFMT